MDQRLRSLDGLRGVAILLVMGFHYFYALAAPSNHTDLYPYGDKFAGFPAFKYGYMGVELFFMISGFVIALTLEGCKTPREFVVRRFARIWPPLLFCSIVTFFVVKLTRSPFSLSTHQSWANFLPSLTLTPRELWMWVSPNVRLVDLVYWSLIVEVRFYIIAGMLFWLFDRASFGRNLVIFSCVNILVRSALKWVLPGSEDFYYLELIPDFLPWFAAGVIFYELYVTRITPAFALFCLVPMVAIIVRASTLVDQAQLSPLVISAIALIFFLMFWLIARRHWVSGLFSTPVLVWIGACSYSIYLLHFEIGMTAISSISKNLPLAAQVAGVIGIAVIVIFASYLSSVFIERPGKLLVTTLVNTKKNHAAAIAADQNT